MQYWILTSEFPPTYGGGISTYCIETALMLSEKKHEVSVFVPNFSIDHYHIEPAPFGKTIHFNPNFYFTKSFLGYEANLSYGFSQIVKLFIEKEGIPDVLESQEYMGIAYYTLLFKNLKYPEFKNLTILITLHAPSFLYLEYNQVIYHRHPYYWTGEMEKFCINAADILISPSQYLVNEIQKRVPFEIKQYQVIKNPYQIHSNLELKKIERNKIVFFGKLTPQKGTLALIKYFNKMWANGSRLQLLMLGGGEHMYHPEGISMTDFLQKKYKNQISNGLLKLLGSIPPEKINQQLSNAHLIIAPSIVDNLPYTVIEAMGNGKIVLASKQGGQSEIIINEKNGFLFDHNDPTSFQDIIEKILSLSNEEINLIGENAYNEIKSNYNKDCIYQQKINYISHVKNSNIGSEKKFPFLYDIPLNKILTNPIKKKTLLSVVIPFYNMGEYVSETINSIKNSSYHNVEIIIINDGSDDVKSLKILQDLKLEKNISIYNIENSGLSNARNYGALKANGDFLAFLDPDDTVEKNYYEKAINILLELDNVFFVGCWAKYFGESNDFWPSFNPEPPYLLVHNMINSSALVYKTKAFLEAGLNDPDLIFGMEDYDSVISMVKNGYRGVVIPEPLWNYRVRKNSMARLFTTDKQLYLYRLISKKHSEFYSIHASEITNILNANGPGINYDNPTQIYSLGGNDIFGKKISRKAIEILKKKPFLRKLALKFKKITRL